MHLRVSDSHSVSPGTKNYLRARRRESVSARRRNANFMHVRRRAANYLWPTWVALRRMEMELSVTTVCQKSEARILRFGCQNSVAFQIEMWPRFSHNCWTRSTCIKKDDAPYFGNTIRQLYVICFIHNSLQKLACYEVGVVIKISLIIE